MEDQGATNWSYIRESVLAENSNDRILPDIKLPSLPKALMEFREKAKCPDVETEELSQIISSDAGLSAELLRSVNCCANGLVNKVTSVKQALIYQGTRKTLLHLTTSSMKQMMKASASKLINLKRFWNANLERSLFAKEIAKLMKADADVAFTAGMLQDFLLPLITNQEFDTYLDYLENEDLGQDLPTYEQEKFGWDHAQAAAQIMFAWNFPDELVCCVFLHHHAEKVISNESLSRTSAAAVAISSYLPDPLQQSQNGIQNLQALESTWPEFNLLDIATRVDADFREMSNGETNNFSLLRRLQKELKSTELETS